MPHDFSVLLSFSGNRIMGEGNDGIGSFSIEGICYPSGDVNFVKQYHGQHAVNYTGRLSPDGTRMSGTYTAGAAFGNFFMALRC